MKNGWKCWWKPCCELAVFSPEFSDNPMFMIGTIPCGFQLFLRSPSIHRGYIGDTPNWPCLLGKSKRVSMEFPSLCYKTSFSCSSQSSSDSDVSCRSAAWCHQPMQNISHWRKQKLFLRGVIWGYQRTYGDTKKKKKKLLLAPTDPISLKPSVS